jgi:hypothetical protein
LWLVEVEEEVLIEVVAVAPVVLELELDYQ